MLAQAKPQGFVKTCPEEFVVREVGEDGEVLEPTFETKIQSAEGLYTRFILTKRGIAAEPAYRNVALRLNVPRESVSECGRKDAQAVTTQEIVVKGNYHPEFHFGSSDGQEMYLQYIGPANGPLSHGQNRGNRFSVFVRTEATMPPEGEWFLNLFGDQRFGDGRYEVGRFLLEGEYADAVNLLWDSPINGKKLQKISERYGLDPLEAMLHPEFRSDLEFKVVQWQSHLWNCLAMQRRPAEEERLPMWDFESIDLYRHLWNPKAVSKEMLDHLHHFKRPVWTRPEHYHIEEGEEGFWHHFTLRSGAFATTFLSSCYEMTDLSRQNFT